MTETRSEASKRLQAAVLPPSEPNRQLMYRLPQVLATTGYARSTLYAQIQGGLWTKAVKVGARSVAWPSGEVAALIRARIAGVNEDGIRLLVARLEAARVDNAD